MIVFGQEKNVSVAIFRDS